MSIGYGLISNIAKAVAAGNVTKKKCDRQLMVGLLGLYSVGDVRVRHTVISSPSTSISRMQ